MAALNNGTTCCISCGYALPKVTRVCSSCGTPQKPARGEYVALAEIEGGGNYGSNQNNNSGAMLTPAAMMTGMRTNPLFVSDLGNICLDCGRVTTIKCEDCKKWFCRNHLTENLKTGCALVCEGCGKTRMTILWVIFILFMVILVGVIFAIV